MAVLIFQVTPRLPALMNTDYAAPSGSTIVVGDGGNFQTALNNANPGDVITLNAGSTYTGNFSLPAKGGSSYIHIRSSAALTTEGSRITTGQAASFPKIATPDNEAAIQATAESSYYRFINCDIKSGSTAVNGYLVGLGTGEETDPDDFPHHIIIDRCHIHGSSANGGRRGVMFAGNYQAVIDSYLSDWKEVGADTQAIAAWTGYGPYKIVNNYLEGAGENVMFGGAGTGGIVLTPSDIEIRGNHFFKPLTWKADDPSYLGTQWSVKNLFELKHAKRVLVDGNIFENCWAESQNGFAIVFTVRNQTGSTPWATVSDVTFTDNTIRNSTCGFNLLGYDEESGISSDYARRLLIERNLGYGILSNAFQMQHRYEDVNINHNTFLHGGETMIIAGQPCPRFRFTNNIVQHNTYGIKGDNQNSGNTTIAAYLPDSVITKNVFATPGEAGMADIYPADNYFPTLLSDVGFVNLTEYADLTLTEDSDYHLLGTDSLDLGADKATPA